MKTIMLRFSLLSLLALFINHAAIASEPYLLNAGDILDISVWKEETLKKEVIVLPDGTISFPLAGVLAAEGKSVTELQLALKKKLTEFLSEPLVTVVVSSVSGNSVHVLGKISNPGSFVMNRQFNVMQALSLAGGLSAYAEENNISIIRGDKVIKVRYADIKNGDISSNMQLQSGDVIVIP
jgi:polysaccharide export outer membrane protein